MVSVFERNNTTASLSARRVCGCCAVGVFVVVEEAVLLREEGLRVISAQLEEAEARALLFSTEAGGYRELEASPGTLFEAATISEMPLPSQYNNARLVRVKKTLLEPFQSLVQAGDKVEVILGYRGCNAESIKTTLTSIVGQRGVQRGVQ